jgi:thiamine pyrophosphate-dependent acetolactate synthase large subunit-like protein
LNPADTAPAAAGALVPIRHGGDRVAAALAAQGVRTIFTLCGGHISPILSGAKARGIRILDTRDEVTAVFAADAEARLTGRPGVAAVTAGPGITNTITALKNAQLAQSPVVLIGGAAPTALQGRGALQDIDQRPLVEPHVKHFFKLTRVRELAPAVAEAFQLAQEGVPGPVFLECPVDLLYDEASIRQWYADAAGKGTALPDRALRWYLNRHAARMFAGVSEAVPQPRPVVAPRASDAALKAAAAKLAAASKPLIVIGSQAVVQAGQADELPLRNGARPARARRAAADAPHAPPGAARVRLRAARRRALRLPPRLRQARAPQRHADRRQPQRARRAPQPCAQRHPAGRRRPEPAGAGRRAARAARRVGRVG